MRTVVALDVDAVLNVDSHKLAPLYTRYGHADALVALDDMVGGKDPALFADRGWLLPDLTGPGYTHYGRGVTSETFEEIAAYWRR